MGLAGAKQNNLRVQHTAVHGRTVLIVARGTYEQKTHLYICVFTRVVDLRGSISIHPCFVLFFVFVFDHHFYFPAQLVGGFTLSDLLDKPWPQVSSLLPPGTCLQFLSRTGFSIPTARRFSSNVANSRSRALR